MFPPSYYCDIVSMLCSMRRDGCRSVCSPWGWDGTRINGSSDQGVKIWWDSWYQTFFYLWSNKFALYFVYIIFRPNKVYTSNQYYFLISFVTFDPIYLRYILFKSVFGNIRYILLISNKCLTIWVYIWHRFNFHRFWWLLTTYWDQSAFLGSI